MTTDALRTELVGLSRAIHGTPELAYQERTAVKNIAALLEKRGHKVEQKLGGVETAFRARTGPPGPAVAFLAEYDALPQIGHACGHNLIAMSNVGAFLLAAERAKDLGVGVELVGTPAEESGGGKIDLIDAGVFRDSIAVLSSPVRRSGMGVRRELAWRRREARDLSWCRVARRVLASPRAQRALRRDPPLRRDRRMATAPAR